MNKLILTAAAFVISLSTSAQIEFPDLSYEGVVRQEVGFTNFEIRYERALQRDRIIFGGLVPYGKPWRTGAGFHNTISFDQDVTVQGKAVKKGTYHLVTIPDPASWKVIFTKDSNAFSQNKPYDATFEVLRIDVKPVKAAKHYEASTIEIDIVNNDALFTISWDHTSISFLVETGTTRKVMTGIRGMMKEENTDPGLYQQAADFLAYNIPYLPEQAKDTALILIDRALELAPNPGMYRIKRNIYWFSKDFRNYEKVSHDWIAFLRTKGTDYDHTEEIRQIEEDLQRYKGKWR